MLSSSILLSGSNFQKVSMMAKFMKFPFISKNSFYKIQRTYLIPAVDEFWTEHQETVFDQFRGRDIVILGKYVRYLLRYLTTLILFETLRHKMAIYTFCSTVYIVQFGSI
mgnify:CR=1 FL=1